MNAKAFYSSIVVVSGLLSGNALFAQTPRVEFPAPSPACTLKQRVGLTDIEIVYSRPGAKDRQVVGGLVPYGEPWRTGANASTKISFSTAVKLNGADVPAGKYALYTIPGETEWTVVVTKDLTSGVPNFNASNDVARLKAKPAKLAEHVETFTIDINDLRDDSATLNLIWEKTRVPIKLALSVKTALVPQIEAVMGSAEGRKPYYQAAAYYFENGLDLQKAKTWVNAAIADREAHYMVHLKAKILAKLGEKDAAVTAAKRSSELAVKAEGPKSGYVKMNEDLIAGLR